MTQSSLSVSAPARLHFGLFSVGPVEANAPYPQYGGMGLMLNWPRQVLVAQPADELKIIGPDRPEIEKIIENWFGFYSTAIFPKQSIMAPSFWQLPICLRQSQALPRHIGLGSGTQLGFATVTLLNRFFKLPFLGPLETAVQTGRGKRSAIGSYGFFQGGFLVDRGKCSAAEVAQLDFQTSFPTTWPILIAFPKQRQGIAGVAEDEAFSQIAATPHSHRESLIELTKQVIVPAVLKADYVGFAESIYQFGRGSGRHFAAVQGGDYNGPQVTRLIQQIRQLGVKGVGQSSWGPCVYAISEDQSQVEWLKDRLEAQWHDHYQFFITNGDNRGARIASV